MMMLNKLIHYKSRFYKKYYFWGFLITSHAQLNCHKVALYYCCLMLFRAITCHNEKTKKLSTFKSCGFQIEVFGIKSFNLKHKIYVKIANIIIQTCFKLWLKFHLCKKNIHNASATTY